MKKIHKGSRIYLREQHDTLANANAMSSNRSIGMSPLNNFLANLELHLRFTPVVKKGGQSCDILYTRRASAPIRRT